jgi:hypothetical protein
MSDGLGTTDEQPEAPKRDANGRWLPGVSGNEGRRGYEQDRSRQAIEAAMRDRGEEVARTVVAAALRGDMVAARIILDRLAPVRKGAPIMFSLPEMLTAAELPVAVAAVSQAMANGEISPDEAASITAVLDVQRRAIETAQLEARLRALEEKANEQA